MTENGHRFVFYFIRKYKKCKNTGNNWKVSMYCDKIRKYWLQNEKIFGISKGEWL